MLELVCMASFGETIKNFFTPAVIGLIVRVVLMLVIGIPVIKLIMKVVGRVLKDKLSLQAEVLVMRTIKYVLMLILLMMIANEFGFKISAILGAAGIFGIAIGFAAQTSVSNIISGIFLIAEKPFVIGDIIDVNGKLGTILAIDLLSVKIKTFDGHFVRVPNETMIKTDVTNITKFDIRRSGIKISVAYKEDVRKVMDILQEIADNIPDGLKDPAPQLNLGGFGDHGVEINFGVWTATSNYINMRTQLILAVKERFDKEGIEIPFPHLTLYAGSASDPFQIEQIKKEV